MNGISDTLDRPEEAAPVQLPLLARLHEWVVTVDHKRLGIMYVGVGLVFLLVAGLAATLMRLQLAFPENTMLSPQVFNRLFTMHGTTMVFFVGIPIVFGFANYLVPLMIGTRDLAFPRLNAFGFWLLLFSGLLLYFSYLAGDGLYGAGSAPDVGWFAYSPLTGRAFSRGNSTDYWNLAILVSGVGTIATSVNLVATILTMRCPGMTLGRMPLYVWMMLVVSGMTLVILPPLSAAQIMLLLDRFLGSHFFDTQAGGSAVLWQHFFWFFGHPEVYVLMVPGFAFASEIIPVFSRKVIFGYPMMVAATIGIGVVSMGVWAHHMFAVGMGSMPNAFFAASTMVVAVPTGVKIFNWLGTIYGGRIRFDIPMLFCLAFLFQFLCAGLTGIMLAVAPFDWQLSDSYFVVAHFHFVLIGALVFTIFAAIYYWFPKATGRMLSDRPGPLAFLALRHRLQSDLHPAAFRRGPRHATAHLHLSGGPRLGPVEPRCHTRRAHTGRGTPPLPDQCDRLVATGQTRRQRPMGCLDARVVDDVATSSLQLRHDSRGQEPSATVGPQASR